MEENTQPTQEPVSAKNTNKIVRAYFLMAWEFLKIVIIAALIVLPIRYYVFQPFIVKG